METKIGKISFGFSKVTNKSQINPTTKVEQAENKIELIKCLEGKSITLLDEKPEIAPLVIPLKESTKTSAALASLLKRRAVLNGDTDEVFEKEVNQTDAVEPLKNETIEQRAARELLAEIREKEASNIDNSTLVLPLKPEELPLDGAVESTIDDYENIPVAQFGLAMLRGMGWKEEEAAKKSLKDLEGPILRPKGMGLGADKAIKQKQLLVQPDVNEVLEIKKNAYIRVLGGKYKDQYGQIEGLDDHAGRVIVKLALGGIKEAFNEFLVQPISKNEYIKYGKVINSAKYDEYKKMENQNGQIIRKNVEKGDINKLTTNNSQRKTEKHYFDDRQEKNLIREKSRSRTRSRSRHNYRKRSPSNSPKRKMYKNNYLRRSRSVENVKSKSKHKTNQIAIRSDASSSDSGKHHYIKKKSKSKKSKNKYKSRSSSDDEDKLCKRKNKKSKKPRSRSRSRGRR